MMTGLIARGSQADCGDLLPAGTRSRLILINYDQVRVIYTVNGKITSVILTPGATAYEFTGFRSDVGKSEEVYDTGYKKRFIHTCSFVVYDVSQVQKNNLKALARGRVMAIVESKGRSDDSIELLGRECGLEIAQGQIREQTDNLFTISLATPGRAEYELKLPQTVGLTYSDGLSIIEDLLAGGGSDANAILTEGADAILTEDGDPILVE